MTVTLENCNDIQTFNRGLSKSEYIEETTFWAVELTRSTYRRLQEKYLNARETTESKSDCHDNSLIPPTLILLYCFPLPLPIPPQIPSPTRPCHNCNF